MEKDIHAIYAIISEIMQNGEGTEMGGLAQRVTQKIGILIADKDIEGYIEEGIFQQNRNYIVLGPIANVFQEPNSLGTVWHELPPAVRKDLVYPTTEYPQQLKSNPLWRIATSPTKKAWITLDEFLPFYEKTVRIEEMKEDVRPYMYKQYLRMNEKDTLVSMYPELDFIKCSTSNEVTLLRRYISEKEDKIKVDARKQLEEKCIKVKQKTVGNKDELANEYLIQWSSDFISPLAEVIQEYDVDEISRRDLTTPEADVSAIGDLLNKNLDRLKSNKVKNIEREREIYWSSIITATKICEGIYASGQLFFNPSAIENKLSKLSGEYKYWKNKRSLIRYEERCPIGFSSEACKGEWKSDDSLDKFAHADIGNARIYVSSFYPGLYITPKTSEILIPINDLYELRTIVNELHRGKGRQARPRDVKFLSQWKIRGSEVICNIGEIDELHPPYSVEFFLPRITINEVLKQARLYRQMHGSDIQSAIIP